MARRDDFEVRVTPSVLDRLLDFEPKASNEAPTSRSKSLRELKNSVRRDLEWLFNTRSYPGEIDERLEETPNSVVAYGLPDFTGISVRSHLELKRLRQSLETAIKNYEPRFLDVKVKLEPIDNTDRILHFRIEAFLNIEPSPEPIVFDTVLELGNGDFNVKES
jgi:type VI secretion system protein ImpF